MGELSLSEAFTARLMLMLILISLIRGSYENYQIFKLIFKYFLILWSGGVSATSQGPVFLVEPPYKIAFSNVTGGAISCSGGEKNQLNNFINLLNS